MSRHIRARRRVEFGDFQTPPVLARQVCEVLRPVIPQPAAVVEPTCGQGSFLVAALEAFPSLRHVTGFEVNSRHVEAARWRLAKQQRPTSFEVYEQDFFDADWNAIFHPQPDPLLVIGNPPWVTSSTLGAIAGSNLPVKTNDQGLKGMEALTGKSNFDISEWMLNRLLESLSGRCAVMAMLCKTTVARKVLLRAWTGGLAVRAEIRPIDTKEHFDASVDAGLLVCDLRGGDSEGEAIVYAHLSGRKLSQRIGLRDGRLVSDLNAYDRTRAYGRPGLMRWRSGVKHDCAKVMEFQRIGDRYRNGLGELVELEPEYLYPVLKSSDVARGGPIQSNRWMLMTQRAVGDDTSAISRQAPKVWKYLLQHSERLDRRASSIYRGRPRFAMFGVGPYSFAAEKVAISCLYKRLSFMQVTAMHGRPAVLDDTCAFLPCRSRDEASLVIRLLQSELARDFYRSRIFWDAKRPITTEVLNQLHLPSLARELEPEHPVTAIWADEAEDESNKPESSQLF